MEEPEVRSAAELHIDTGMSKYANADGLATTILRLPHLQVIRFGLFYDKIRDVFARDFGFELPQKGSWTHREELDAVAAWAA